jgi:hypothetical protein
MNERLLLARSPGESGNIDKPAPGAAESIVVSVDRPAIVVEHWVSSCS